jgi:hypothetical protein
VVGAPVVVSRPRGSSHAHSPFPIHGVDGDVEGLLVCEHITGSTSHWQWAGDLDPATPPIPMFTSTAWDNNGCLAGGRIYMVRSLTGQTTVIEYDVAALLGDDALCAGDYGEITVIGPTRPQGSFPDVCYVFAALSYTPAPVPLPPPVVGALGLGAPLFTLGSCEIDPATGLGAVPFLMPSVAQGAVALQGLTINLSTGSAFALTSTASFRLLGGQGTRSAQVLSTAPSVADLEILEGEPFERVALPTQHGAIQTVRFAPPDDPQNPWVAGRDFAVVQRPDGTAFLDVRRMGGLVVEVTTASDVVKKFFVKSKKLAFTQRGGSLKMAPPWVLPQQYVRPFVVRQKGTPRDGYTNGLRTIFPTAPEFDSVDRLRRLIVDEYYRPGRGGGRLDVMVCCHGFSGAFMVNGDSWVGAEVVPAQPGQPRAFRLDDNARALLDGAGGNEGIKGKVGTMVIFACQVTCTGDDNFGPWFQDAFTEALDDNDPGQEARVIAWDVCSYTCAPFWGLVPAGGTYRWQAFPAWLGIAAGRAPRTVTR